MTQSLFSTSWYRVAEMRPRLRSHVRIHRHYYRSLEWYIIQDHSTGKFHRFSPEAYEVIGRMDGRNTLAAIWKAACEKLEAHMPTQDEVLGLISKLYRADVLQADISPDIRDLFQRFTEAKRNRFFNFLMSPMSMKFPLFDPNRFLDRTYFLVRPLLSRWGAALYLMVVLPALVTAALNWQALTGNFADRVLSMQNLAMIWLIYPVLKLFHEFAHAYAVKRWGGEVHEMGIMLLVFVPIPYVDASAASAMADKWQRMFIGAAGILAELFAASVALAIWLNVTPGSLHAVAYNVMIIAGVSTLLFNGNPLLRFDAYYVLSDFLELPNLSMRGNQYIGYLIRRYLLSDRDAQSPADGKDEGPRLGIYAAAAFVYRIYIAVRIILLVAGRFMAVGVALALWTCAAMLVMPVTRVVRQMTADPALAEKKGRIMALAGGFLILFLIAVCLLPFPRMTVTQGVLWPSEKARVHAGTAGFIEKVLATSGSPVRAGDALLACENIETAVDVRVLKARMEELAARYRQSLQQDLTEADILKDEMAHVQAELQRATEKVHDLTVRSPQDGVFILPLAADLPGRFVHRGDPLGFVLDPSRMTVRLVVSEADIEAVSDPALKVTARLAGDADRVLPARILRIEPAATRDLPSMALSLEGGGDYALDPRAPKTSRVLERLFQIEIALPEGSTHRIGERVFVRFEYAPEPLMYRWYRQVRRLFLKRFEL